MAEGAFIHDSNTSDYIILHLRYTERAKLGAVAAARTFILIILDKAQLVIAQGPGRADFNTGSLGTVVARMFSGVPNRLLLYRV